MKHKNFSHEASKQHSKSQINAWKPWDRQPNKTHGLTCVFYVYPVISRDRRSLEQPRSDLIQRVSPGLNVPQSHLAISYHRI